MSAGARLSRRSLVLGLSALGASACVSGAGCSSCRRASKPAVGGRWIELEFGVDELAPGGQHALLFLPDGATRDTPLLVALHGRGECAKGLVGGARGWRDDYGLDETREKLSSLPLRASGEGEGAIEFATRERLRLVSASLEKRAFGPLAIVCPYTPDLKARTADEVSGLARFVVERLVPRARREAGLGDEPSKTGIDGVSLGGRLALLIGLSRPEAFGAIGALQPALRADDAPALSALAQRAEAGRVRPLRLVSSVADPFLSAIRVVSTRLKQDGVAHDLVVTEGPHDYAWNRGAGGMEMLVFHDRALRGLAPP